MLRRLAVSQHSRAAVRLACARATPAIGCPPPTRNTTPPCRALSSSTTTTPLENTLAVEAAAEVPSELNAAPDASESQDAPQVSYANMLRSAAHAQRYGECVELWEKMQAEGVAPTEESLPPLAEALAAEKTLVAALELVRAHGTLVGGTGGRAVRLYRGLLNSSAKGPNASDLATTQALVNDVMERFSGAPDGERMLKLASDVLVSAYCRAQQFEEAEKVIETMREKRNLRPNSHTYTRYVQGALSHGEANLAHAMLKHADSTGRSPDLGTYRQIIEKFSALGHDEGARHCAEAVISMATAPMTNSSRSKKPAEADAPNGRGVQAMSRADALAREIRLAHDNEKHSLVAGYFSIALAEKVPLTAGIVAKAMRSMLKSERPLLAFSAACELVDRGKPIFRREHDALADGLATETQLVDAAFFEVEKRAQGGGVASPDALNLVIEACARMRDPDRAFATFAEMETLGIKPNVGTFNALLATCVYAREHPTARRLISRMEADGIAPNPKTYECRLALQAQAKDRFGSRAVLDDCVKAGLVPTTRMYVTIFNQIIPRSQETRSQYLTQPRIDAARRLIDDVASVIEKMAGEENPSVTSDGVNKNDYERIHKLLTERLQRAVGENTALGGDGNIPAAPQRDPLDVLEERERALTEEERAA